MGKDKSEKKDKHEKKEKRAEKDGIHKSKKEKKEKKDKTALTNAVEQELTTKVLDGIDQAVAGEAATGDVQMVDGRPIGALVPFAQPLVEDKAAKKVLKSVKKGRFALAVYWRRHISWDAVVCLVTRTMGDACVDIHSRELERDTRSSIGPCYRNEPLTGLVIC